MSKADCGCAGRWLPCFWRLIAVAAVAVQAVPSALLRAEDAAPDYDEHQNLSYYLDADRQKHPIRSREDWATRRQHILEHMQSVMGPLPRPAEPVPLDVETVETEPVGELIRRKITYHTDSPQRRVAAYLFLPPLKEGEKRPAILCLHPTGEPGKKIVSGLTDRPNRSYALELAERGYVTLAPDYPSFGDYAYAFPAEDSYISGTMKAIYDNIRGVDLLQSLPEVDPERIGCMGHSLGGHNAIFTAAFEPRIRAIVSSCGFTRFHKYYEGNLKGWTSPRYMPLIATRHGNDPDQVPFDFTEIVACLAPRPFLAVAPLHDDNFEVSGVRDVIAAARPIYELHEAGENLRAIYPDAAHDFLPDARETAYRFVDRHLGQSPVE